MKDYDRHRFMTEPHLWLSKNNDGDIYINVDRVDLIDDRTIMRYRRSLCDTLCQIDEEKSIEANPQKNVVRPHPAWCQARRIPRNQGVLVKTAVRCPKSNDSKVRLWRRWIDTKRFHACPISSRL